MNIELIVFLIIVYSVGNGKLILNTKGRTLRQQAHSKCDLTTKPQCSSDSSSILVCIKGSEIPVRSIKCNSNAPFCDRGVCTSTPNNFSLNTETSSFFCTSRGVFPNPTDCTKYFSCSAPGSLSTELLCPVGSIYNSKWKRCQLGVPKFGHASRNICRKISCDKVENAFIVFIANPAYYAFCSVTGSVKQIFMFKCDNEESFVFDSNTRSCIFNCKASGYFADSSDCSAYYICNSNRKFTTFTSKRMTCPSGFYFNGTACVNSTKHCQIGSFIHTTTMETSTSTQSSYHVTTLTTSTELTTENQPSSLVTESSLQPTEASIHLTLIQASAVSSSTESCSSVQSSTFVITSALTENESDSLPIETCEFSIEASTDLLSTQVAATIATVEPSFTESLTSALSATYAIETPFDAELPSTTAPLDTVTTLPLISITAIQPSNALTTITTEFSAEEITGSYSTLPSFSASLSNILFLPCPLWLLASNDQICSQIGSYLYYGKQNRSQSTSVPTSPLTENEQVSISAATSTHAIETGQSSIEISAVITSASAPLGCVTAVSSLIGSESFNSLTAVISKSCAEEVTGSYSTLPSFNASLSNILFLPCALWLKVSNYQICSQIGSYLNYGKHNQSQSYVTTAPLTDITTVKPSNSLTTFTPESSAEEVTGSYSTLPSFKASLSSILFLPCPFWLKVSNDQICSQSGSYLNYGKRKRTSANITKIDVGF